MNDTKTKLALAISAMNEFDVDVTYSAAKETDRTNRGPSVMHALPANIKEMWKHRDELNARIVRTIYNTGITIREGLQVIDDPLAAIGKRVSKKSGKPFKGGDDVITIHGVIKHPNTKGYAFTYMYVDVHGTAQTSYVHTSMVKIDLSEYTELFNAN
ncbi:hypothetical protein MYOV011v1_p0327 [Vibrio phage 6E35.1a]|nr:hypothetical protein MYOV011v1_p0327 [Vibrio phage 6E35.1a]